MLKRLVFVVFIAFFSSFLCFVMLHFSKGSVAFVKGGNAVSLESRQRLEATLGLDRPLLEQYGAWLFRAFRGDLGLSFISGERVFDLIKERLGNTLILSLSALVLLFFLSLALALLCLLYENSLLDRALSFISTFFLALPGFALALLSILLFGVFLQILPTSGTSDIGLEDDFFNRLNHLILPLSILVLSHLAVFMQVARNALIESHHKPFILNAYARGLRRRRIFLHFTLKYALTPVISYFGACALSFMMSTYVVEGVFSYAGLGNLMIQSILYKDYPVVLALVFISVLLAGFFTFMADCLCKLIHPRIE